MAATKANRRRADSPAPIRRQGLRSQMRITKPAEPVVPKRRTVTKEIKKEAKQETRELSSLPAAPAKPSPKARSRKSKTHVTGTPFPDFARPTLKDCTLAHSILTSLHGERKRPEKVVASSSVAGCGDSPAVLDALVRTILSQNTSAANSTRAMKSMATVYGSSDAWDAIFAGGQPRLQKAIQCGGLSVSKSKSIFHLLSEVKAKYGKFSLDHLFEASDAEAMEELLSFPGVGPKTASCILLFCLQRPSFAVDTHVHRITGLMGWRPEQATREQAQAHLDDVVPDEFKYPLHVLLIAHGRTCGVCSAKPTEGGTCTLREAFSS